VQSQLQRSNDRFRCTPIAANGTDGEPAPGLQTIWLPYGVALLGSFCNAFGPDQKPVGLAYSSMLVLFMAQTLHQSLGVIGAFLSVSAVGGLAGAFVARRLAGRLGQGPCHARRRFPPGRPSRSWKILVHTRARIFHDLLAW
jgi:hypothetical protein